MADKDYIERSKAMEHGVIVDIGIWSGYVIPVKEIENIPAADVRPVVLCKNCVYREVDEYGVHFCTGAMAEAPTGDDWYCACGKPRDETAIS